jgi:hypothetical protein
MKMYNYSAKLTVSGEVEAESLDEAERIIEGVLKSPFGVTIQESLGDGDELGCTVTDYVRGSIRAEV